MTQSDEPVEQGENAVDQLQRIEQLVIALGQRVEQVEVSRRMVVFFSKLLVVHLVVASGCLLGLASDYNGSWLGLPWLIGAATILGLMHAVSSRSASNRWQTLLLICVVLVFVLACRDRSFQRGIQAVCGISGIVAVYLLAVIAAAKVVANRRGVVLVAPDSPPPAAREVGWRLFFECAAALVCVALIDWFFVSLNSSGLHRAFAPSAVHILLAAVVVYGCAVGTMFTFAYVAIARGGGWRRLVLIGVSVLLGISAVDVVIWCIFAIASITGLGGIGRLFAWDITRVLLFPLTQFLPPVLTLVALHFSGHRHVVLKCAADTTGTTQDDATILVTAPGRPTAS